MSKKCVCNGKYDIKNQYGGCKFSNFFDVTTLGPAGPKEACFVGKKGDEQATADNLLPPSDCGQVGDNLAWNPYNKMWMVNSSNPNAKECGGKKTWVLILIIMGSIIGAFILGYLLYIYIM